MLPQLRDRLVEGLHRARGARAHDRAFHHGEDESGERLGLHVRRQAIGGGLDPRRDAGEPVLEVPFDPLADLRVVVGELEREVPDRAAHVEAREFEPFAIEPEEREDALDRVLRARLRGLEHLRSQERHVPLEDADEEILLAREEVVEAPAVDLRLAEHRRDPRRVVPLLVEEPGGDVEDSFSGGSGAHGVGSDS